MGLRGDIKTGGWLVEKQRFGVASKRHCNGHPLLLAARQFMRIAIGKPNRIGKANLTQKINHTRVKAGCRKIAMQAQGFNDLLSNTQIRGQGLA